MVLNRHTASAKAKHDLAKRLGIGEGDVSVSKVTDRDFPDMSLGLTQPGEMAAQMISSGWEIALTAGGKNYEYRADKYQIRLKDFDGKNHVVK